MSVADWEAPMPVLAYASSAYRLILDRATRRVTMSDDAAAELFPAAPTPL
jgi:hypothetical protein